MRTQTYKQKHPNELNSNRNFNNRENALKILAKAKEMEKKRGEQKMVRDEEHNCIKLVTVS